MLRSSTARFSFLAYLFAIALVGSSAAALAQPLAVRVNVINNTANDAWVDVSWSYPAQPWHIASAFCLRPHQSRDHVETYNVGSFVPQARVRAEIKRGDCRSANVATVAWDKGLKEDFLNAKAFYDVTIKQNGNRYDLIAERH